MPRPIKKRSPEKPKIPCQYNCGRLAEGTLMVNYTIFQEVEDSYRHGFSVTLPCCRECLKKAVNVSINIPKVENN